MTKPRNYKAEYARYHGKPEQIKQRAQRVQAKRDYEKANGRVPAGMDVHHKTPINKGGSNSLSNMALTSKAKNRGYKRNSRNQPI
jgi:5-methylcytosine-specific restriction endonuclease McrA